MSANVEGPQTNPALVEKVMQTPQPLNKYVKHGRKIPTDVSIKYDGRIRRVYKMNYETVRAFWINVDKKTVFLDAKTEKQVQRSFND